MQNTIHIAIGSTMSLPGQIDDNLQQISAFAQRAAGDGAHILLTPEMSATGYGAYPEIIDACEVAGDGPIYRCLAHIARATGVVICAGFAERAGETKYLAHYVVFPDESFLVQRKHFLTGHELGQFTSQLPPGTDYHSNPAPHFRFRTFEVHGVGCAIAICADMGLRELHSVLDELQVRVLLSPTGAGGLREDRVTTEDLTTVEGRDKYYEVLQTLFLPSRALIDCIAHQRALAAVNLCGFDGQRFYHAGHGSITNPMGEVVAGFHGLPNLDRQRPMYAHAEIDLNHSVGPVRS